MFVLAEDVGMCSWSEFRCFGEVCWLLAFMVTIVRGATFVLLSKPPHISSLQIQSLEWTLKPNYVAPSQHSFGTTFQRPSLTLGFLKGKTHTHIDTIDTSTFRSGSPITSCGSPTSGTPLTDTPSFASTERSTLDPSLRSALGSPKKLCLGRRGFSTVAVCRGAKKGRRTEGTSL